MKLKTIKRTNTIIETDLDLPVYLYFQDEFDYDELIKITDKEKITILYEVNKLSIIVETNFIIDNNYINNKSNITTEEHFNYVYNQALNQIKL
jgi:hypothetical protein